MKVSKRLRRRLLLAGAIVMLPLSLFYLFVVPALVASGAMEISGFSVGFAAFLFTQFWMLTAESAYASAARLYGFRRKHLFPFLLPIRESRDQDHRVVNPVVAGLLSYLLTIYGFAVAYTFISNMDASAFSCGRMNLFEASYFSLITAATIGYGDIAPVSTVARCFVMAQILLAFTYALFLLSVFSSYLRSRGPDAAPAATPPGPEGQPSGTHSEAAESGADTADSGTSAGQGESLAPPGEPPGEV